jgi:hypothetical protein
MASSGALIAYSGEKTGGHPGTSTSFAIRTPRPRSRGVRWGPVNVAIPEATFGVNRERATDYLKTRNRSSSRLLSRGTFAFFSRSPNVFTISRKRRGVIIHQAQPTHAVWRLHRVFAP